MGNYKNDGNPLLIMKGYTKFLTLGLLGRSSLKNNMVEKTRETPLILKSALNRGYLQVSLNKNGKQLSKRAPKTFVKEVRMTPLPISLFMCLWTVACIRMKP